MKLNANQELLRSRLEQTRDMGGDLRRIGHHYKNPYDFVLQEGRFYEPRPLPEGFEQQPPRQCYLSAFEVAFERELPYVEGYAVRHGNWWLHAWNLNDDGTVIDTSWGIADAYMGVIIPMQIVMELWRMRNHGVDTAIDDWTRDWPLLKNKWASVAPANTPLAGNKILQSK